MKKFLRTLVAPTAAVALTLSVTPASLAQEAPAEQQSGSIVSPMGPGDVENAKTTGEPQTWYGIAQEDDRVDEVMVHSASMNRNIPVALIPATNEAGERVADAPTIYLLNGAGGAEQNNDWLTLNPSTGEHEGTIDFYSGKGVNVVIPMAGAFSYYLDWYEDPNGSYLNGPQKWETFLTKELPGPIEGHLNANDQRGIIGFSMSATSAALFAEHNPGYYDAVAGFSGYYQTTGPVSHGVHFLTLDRGGATPQQMLGPMNGPHNLYNDAVINAEGLRESELYFSNSSGLAGETDQAGYYIERGADPSVALANSAVLQIEGGVIEAATNSSTHDLKAKLDSLGIDATFNFRNTGTHSWPTWRDDIGASWPTFERAFFG